ncbi:MAG: inovirus-type Gp2 protein [Tolumonas sp.]|nr:inovirus-type Gp2 protein [Tolumonas sp.]
MTKLYEKKRLSMANSKRSFLITEHNSTLFAYKSHAYDVYKPEVKGLNFNMVNKIISDYETMLSHYSKVLVCRIDLHPRKYSVDNQCIEGFLSDLVGNLKLRYKCKVLYHCAREQNSSEKEHYHIEVMLSGHKINFSGKLLSIVKVMWGKSTGGTVSFVDNPFCLVLRGDKSSLKQAIYRSSYLAKEHTKELNGKIKGFLSNHVKPNKDLDQKLDLMLVNPNVTFHKNSLKNLYLNTKSIDIQKNKSKQPINGWFFSSSSFLQHKECISSRATSLNCLFEIPSPITAALVKI